MFTLLLSAFWFRHEFTAGQWMAVLLVFAAITLETVMKRRAATVSKTTTLTKKSE
jgi:EamA domain-containing membrane protein RarD